MARRRVVLPAVAIVLCALAAGPASALEWPVAKPVITGNFGEDRGDHFHLGVDLGGGEQPVYPALPGELVFRYEENADYSSLPRGVGSFVVLSHPDNVLTVYCHLKTDDRRPTTTKYAARDVLGILGETGASEGKHLHLMVYDGETRSFVNPLSLLPPIPDHQVPTIGRIALRYGDRLVDLLADAQVPAGPAEVLVEAWDSREDVWYRWPMAPYALRLSVNGREISRITFDSIQTLEGRMAIRGAGLAPADVYSGGLVVLGEVDLRGGESHLLVTVDDFAGNEANRELFFSVRE